MNDLTKGSVTRALLIVAIPTMISSLLQFSYNIIDMYFLGRYDTSGSIIASVGSSSLFIGLAVGISFLSVLGTGIKSSQSIGAKDEKAFKQYVSSGLFLTSILSVLILIILLTLSPFFISLLGLTEQNIYNNSVLYLRIYSIAIFFSFFNSFFTRIMSSMGTSDKALKINAIGILFNVILDPIFIFKFDLGLKGACYATIISNLIVTCVYLYTYKDIFIIKKENVQSSKIKDIVTLSYPYVIQRIIFSLVSITMGKIIIASGSSSAIAGQRVGLQIESVTLMVIGGLLTATSAFTGQNFGAKQYARVKKGFNKALEIGIAYALFTGLIFFLFAPFIIGLFTDNTETIYYGKMYLYTVAIGQIFGVFEMVGNGFYNGISRPKIPTIISITITPLRIVFALLLVPHFGTIGVFVGIMITTVLKGIVSYGYYVFKVKKQLHE